MERRDCVVIRRKGMWAKYISSWIGHQGRFRVARHLDPVGRVGREIPAGDVRRDLGKSEIDPNRCGCVILELIDLPREAGYQVTGFDFDLPLLPALVWEQVYSSPLTLVSTVLNRKRPCGGLILSARRHTLSYQVINRQVPANCVLAPGMRDHVLPRCSLTGADRKFSNWRVPHDDPHQQKLLVPFDQASFCHSRTTGICGEQI